MFNKSQAKILAVYISFLIVFMCISLFVLADGNSVTKDYNESTKEITIINDSVELVKFKLIDNTDYCSGYCYANISGESIQDVFLFDNLSFYDKENNIKQIGNYNITVRDDKGKIISDKVKFKGKFWIFIEGWKEMQESYDWILDVMGVKLSEWAWWYGVQQVYDEINDSSINASLWTTSDLGQFDSFIDENNDYLRIYSQPYSGARTEASITSINLPPISTIENLTIRTYAAANAASAEGDDAYVQLKILGNYIFNIHVNNGESFSDASVFKCIRNTTAGASAFEVYNDDVWNQTISANNVIYGHTTSYADAGATSSEVRIYYVYYALRSELTSTLSIPTNNTAQNTSSVEFICNQTSTSNQLVNSTLYIWNSTGSQITNTTNITGTSNSTTFNRVLSDDDYTWNCLVYDSQSTSDWANNNFTLIIDTINPQINTAYPLNNTYSVITQFNYTYTEINCDKVWYSNDSGVTNYSIQNCGDNFTGMITQENSNTWIVYINDSAGNENSSSITFAIDTINPSVTILNEYPSDPTTYSFGGTYKFNVTAIDINIDTILLEFDGVNYSTTKTGDVYNKTFTDLSAGTYNYKWIANDTSNNVNNTETGSYIINKATPIGSLNSDLGWTINETQEVVIDLSESNSGDGGVTYVVYRDEVSKGAGETWTPVYGTYDYVLNTTGGANYSSAVNIDSHTLTVNDITNPITQITYPTNTTYATAPTNFNFTYTETNPDKCWYSNDSGVTNYSIQACTSNFTGMVSTENSQNTWIVYINDSAGNENSSSITFTYDTENPNAALYSPENNTYLNTSSNNFTSNLTDNLGLKNATINIYNSTGLVNQTTQSLSDATSYTWGIVIDLVDGVYTWFVELFDLADNSDTTENQTFTIDTTYPLISLIYPTAVNYTSVQTQLNFTKSDTNLAGCWYNLGGANSSYDETCANISGLDSGQGTKTWVIYVNDSSGNKNSSSITFFVDSIVPVVDIEHPHPQTYSYNESLPLNYTSTDTNLESCWYKVVNSTSALTISNTTITDCLNTTFNVPRSDDYTLTLYSNDTLGNENLDTVTFQISLASPSIVLDYPTDNLWLTEKDNIYFNFTATDTNGLDVCELWTNSTGTWHKNVTFTGIISGTQNNTQINLAETKGYIWNVWCNDTTGLEDWALNNFTFNVDTTDPLIEYTTGTKLNNTNTTNTFIFVNVTASDTNENNIVFKLFNQTNQVNSTILTNNEREINWTNLPDEIYTYNVTITDDSGRSNTTTLRTITLDDTVPTLNIILPQAINYADNNTVKLNYTVSDNLIGLDVCWYNVINSTGDIIISNTTTGCLNTTFGLPSGDVDYTLTLYANDTLGNTNSNLVTFGIRTESPAVVLTPTNNTHVNNGTELYFNFTVTTNADSITNCSLYGNFNGTWLLNQTILIPVEGVNTNFSAISLTEGNFIWNVLCYDDLGNNGWALNNLSFTTDITYPNITINSITPTTNSKTFWFNQTTTDTNIDSCKYSIYDATNAIDGGNENVSFTCGTGLRVNATVTDYATYTLKIYAIDLASNENSTNSSFTTSEAAPTPTGGGGGITTIEADTGYCGDGICNESRGETFFNCPEDCSQAFPTLNLDNIYFNCFDDDETTECIWTTNPGLFIVLGFMLFVLMFSILFEFKKEAVGIKKWTFKPKIKKWRRWRR